MSKNLLSQMSEFTSQVVTRELQTPALQQMETWTLNENSDIVKTRQLSDEVSQQPLTDRLTEITHENSGEALIQIPADRVDEYNQAALQAELVMSVMLVQDGKASVLIRNPTETIEIRIACCGNVDAGKSTLLGVLTSGDLDDGRGHARLHLFKHQHEIATGRTSSVGNEIMGFDIHGNHIFKSDQSTSKKTVRLTWEETSQRSYKVISFLDLAGHEKYLKTTVFGLSGCSPDYVLLIVGSNAGIIGMTKEHLGLALALNVPVLVAVTKIDMCPPNVLENTIKQLTKILKSSGCRKIPMFVTDQQQVINTAKNFVSERICPIFQVSNVSGVGIDLLKQFINLLPVYKKYDINAPAEFMITDNFSVPGVGTVVSGTVLNGTVRASDVLLLGPDSAGQFIEAQIRSIHKKRCLVSSVTAGSSACFALRKIKRSFLRKGMVMMAKELKPFAVMEFEAEVLILYHSSTISEHYQAMVHVGNIRQTARIICINEIVSASSSESKENHKKVIRTGDRALVRFRFVKLPEFIKVGTRLLFREGRTKGVGKITKVFQTTRKESDM